MSNAVVALGGNAILQAGEKATFSIQMGHLENTAKTLVSLLDDFNALIVTHGNGPQVGDILLQNEIAKEEIPPMPLDACVAESQGLIGFMLQTAIMNELRRSRKKADMMCCLTLVEIDANPVPPSKPIGPYYDKEMAEMLREQKGWEMRLDPGRGGYRRLVPSPRPRSIIGLAALQTLMAEHRSSPLILIVGGGGGVPVVRDGDTYLGREAVVDKDLTSSLLACSLGADTLIMLTDIGAVYRDYGKVSEQPIRTIGPAELETLLSQGQFPPGSMGPKVQAAISFVRGCGKRALITDAPTLPDALLGKAGTTVVRERSRTE
ncbi:MAG: Carbamate kinase [Methanomassiliicoccales archaeon PtaU1.Bin124]|nr:MAG: Carbamate kinase [Methanomassiliicoccales archaeon PtaU1.Bin124]